MTKEQYLDRIGKWLGVVFPSGPPERRNWKSPSYKPLLQKIFADAKQDGVFISGEEISLQFPEYNDGKYADDFSHVCDAWDEWS